MQSDSITRRTLASYLDDYLQRGDAIVFVQRRGLRYVRWSYRQLVLTARRTARELESRGIAKGDRILLCGESSPEWVAAFWGCLLYGAVVVPLDKDNTEEFVFAVQQQTDAKLIFADYEVRFAERLNIPRVTMNELSERVASHSAEPYPIESVDESTLVEIIFTSGTTSTPKGVLLTHRNLLANLLPMETEIAKYIKWERFFHPIRFLNLVPLSHVFGQFMGVFVPQLLGGEVHFHDTLNPAEIVRRTRESRISVIVLVPRMLDTLREWVERNHAARSEDVVQLEDQLARAKDAHFLRRWWMFRDVHRQFGWKFWAFLSGGATLDERTEIFWRRLGYGVLQGYGMTETASLITVTHPFKGGRGSIGKLMPGYEVKLDESGEIIVRGASVSPGYLTAEGHIIRDAGEWLHTGDVGAMDDAGNLFFKGRKGDVIVTAAGLNIYPEDLEEALNRQPEVRASCVISWSDPHGKEPVAPLAVIILRDSRVRESRASAAAAIERANQSLAEHQRIRLWHVWTEPDFPRTATHKILKREVAERVLKDEGGRMKDEGTIGATSDESGSISSFIPHPSSLSSLDSLGRIELLSALEERYQIEIDEAAFTAATTVEEIEQIVRGEVRGTHLEVAVSARRNPQSAIPNPKFPFPYPKWSRKFPITWLRFLLFYMLILPITRVMSRMRVEGVQHLDKLTGPILFVANHVTIADQALILVALPPRLRHRLAIAMEGERLRGWLHPPAGTTWFMRLRLLAQYILVTTFFHVFPLPKQSGFRRAFAYAGECVDRGDSLLVFPEGERAPRGQMHMSPFRPGIGLLANELNGIATKERNVSRVQERNVSLSQERNVSRVQERNVSLSQERNVALDQELHVNSGKERNVTLNKKLNVTSDQEATVISGEELNVATGKERDVSQGRALNVPVVPVKLHGLYELKLRQQYFASPGMVSVVFAEPLKLDPTLPPAAIAEDLQRRLKAM